MRLLEQKWQPEYNYCVMCSNKLKKSVSIACSTPCWNALRTVRDAVKKRKVIEKQGVRLTHQKEIAEFNHLQSYLSEWI